MNGSIESIESKQLLQKANLSEEIKKVIDILLDNKVEDITCIDLKEISAISDMMIIGTVLSEVHSRSLVRKIPNYLKQHNISKPIREEGVNRGNWVVMDFADFMVHLMTPPFRQTYQLENLWANAKIIRIIDHLESESHSRI